MKISLKFICSVLVFGAMAGCASTQPEIAGLRKIEKGDAVYLDEPIFWPQATLKGVVVVYGGLVPGRYVAENENDLGTFYRGPKGARFMFTTKTDDMWKKSPPSIMRLEGGIWVPKVGEMPRIYTYRDSTALSRRVFLEDSAQPQQHAIFQNADPAASGGANAVNDLAINAVIANPSGAGVVGGAVAGALVNGIVSAGDGSAYLSDIPGEAVDARSELMEKVKSRLHVEKP
ncbi:hypothetical protein RBH89_24105 [Paracidovorax avenae]